MGYTNSFERNSVNLQFIHQEIRSRSLEMSIKNSKQQVDSSAISDRSDAISNSSLQDQSKWRIGDSMHNPLSLNWSYPTISTSEMGEEVLLRAPWGNTEEESDTQIMCK